MPNSRQTRGTNFENTVALYLEREHGFRIVARKYRVPLGSSSNRRRPWVEIDLLAEERGTSRLWLIEAKNHCDAASSTLPLVSRSQLARLMRALQSLRREHPGRQVFWALAWRNPSGGVEFRPNPCYF